MSKISQNNLKGFCSEQIWNISNIQNFPKCSTWFIGNFSCKLFFSTIWDVPKQVSEHYEMFPIKQCPEYFRTFSNVLMFRYNFEMFFQSYLKCFETIWNIFKQIWNIFNHAKHYEVFNTINWVLFMQTPRCFQTNLFVSEHSKMFPNILGQFLITQNIMKCSKLFKMF